MSWITGDFSNTRDVLDALNQRPQYAPYFCTYTSGPCPDCAALRQQLADAQAREAGLGAKVDAFRRENEKVLRALRWTVNAMCGCSKDDGGPLQPGEYEAAVESGKAALQEAQQ